jgi:hypothetical protein
MQKFLLGVTHAGEGCRSGAPKEKAA